MNNLNRTIVRTDRAADYIGLSVSTLNKLRLTGSGPKYIELNRAVVYDTRDLDGWLDANRRKSTSVAA